MGNIFASGSVCEMLLLLWKEHEVEMFGEADAEYTLLLYNAPHEQLYCRTGPHRRPASALSFGDLEFIEYVMSIGPVRKLNVYGKGK